MDRTESQQSGRDLKNLTSGLTVILIIVYASVHGTIPTGLVAEKTDTFSGEILALNITVGYIEETTATLGAIGVYTSVRLVGGNISIIEVDTARLLTSSSDVSSKRLRKRIRVPTLYTCLCGSMWVYPNRGYPRKNGLLDITTFVPQFVITRRQV